MRIFLINFTQKAVAEKLVQKGAEIIYWTGKDRHFKNARDEKQFFSKTIFHNTEDVSKALPALEVKNLKLDFPPQEVLKALTDIEYQVLEMISRVDYTKTLVFNERVDLFYKYIIYWYGVLKHFQPETIIFTDIPHAGSNYVIYSLAKILGIKTIMYRFVKGLPGRLIFFSDLKNYQELRSVYERALADGVSFDDLGEEMKDYVKKQKKIDIETTLTHAAHIEKLIKQGEKIPKIFPSLKSFTRHIRKRNLIIIRQYFFMLFHRRKIAAIDRENYSGLQLKWLFYKWNKIKKAYRKEYESFQVKADLDQKYVYVPLHFQPECNTNPVGGIFDDQILLVRMLAESIPDDWFIYIKENPMQWLHFQGNFGRFTGYYRTLSSLPKVKLVSINTSTFQLINKAQAVATITGSAGLEALVRAKPVLMFGYGWFMDCDGVLRVDGIESCREAIQKIENGYKPEEDKVTAFLYALEKVTMPGSFNTKYSQFSSVSAEENTINITNKLLRELNLL